MASETARAYAFEGYRLDLSSRQVVDAAGHPLPLTSKAIDVLAHLIEHRDRVVNKDELLARVWPGRVVEENNLNQAVSALRRAFGTGAGDHRYIVTVPGHGYRFVAEVATLGDVTPATPATPDARGPSSRRRWLLVALAAVPLLLAVIVLLLPQPARSPPTPANAAALAVLPFRPVPADRGDELLELGMAETLIARLSQTTALRVRSLDASQRFRSRDPMDAGRELQVGYVVAGSAQHLGERTRVTVRLLHVPDGRTLWAGTFDEPRDRVFNLQDAIADAVAGALAVKISPARTHGRSPCDGDNAEAYRAYLAGRFALSRASAQRLPEAEAAMRRAIRLDPTCARAYAGLASLHLWQISIADRDPVEHYRLASQAVERALALDPQSAEAYVARGFIESGFDWDAARAEASFARALELDPASAEAHVGYAEMLQFVGRADEAALHIWRAHELDPLSPDVTLSAAGWLFNADPPAARALMARALEMEPDYWAALWLRAAWARQQGRMAEAVADLEQAAQRSGRNSRVLSSLARAYAGTGQPERVRPLLDELLRRQRDAYVHPSALAITYYELGDNAHALDQLERAYAQRDGRIINLGEDPYWRRLHEFPRFQALARQAVMKTAAPAARD